MKSVYTKLAFAVLGLLFSVNSFAGFLFEPYIGYETGKTKSGSTEEDVTATTLGARLGFKMMGAWAGVDVSQASTKADTGDGTFTDMGVAVGYNFPVLIRLYAVYTASSAGKFDNDVTTTGKGTKIGLGYAGLPVVAINLEMVTRDIEKIKMGSAPEQDYDSTGSTTMLSLSFPL